MKSPSMALSSLIHLNSRKSFRASEKPTGYVTEEGPEPLLLVLVLRVVHEEAEGVLEHLAQLIATVW